MVLVREGPEDFLVKMAAVVLGLVSLHYICGIVDVNYCIEVFICIRHFSKNVSARKEVAVVSAMGMMPSAGISVVLRNTSLPL